jgi:hypothetical protein
MKALLLWVVFCMSIIPMGCSCPADGSCPIDPNLDPRCQTLCYDEPPSVEGAFEVCSSASLDWCKALCSAQIDGVSSMCASCLLEDARFYSPEWGRSWKYFACDAELGKCELYICGYDSCWTACEFEIGNQSEFQSCLGSVSGYVKLCLPDSDTCDVYDADSQEIVCSFAEDNDDERGDCLRQLYPREEVECSPPEFRSVLECKEVCDDGGADGGT